MKRLALVTTIISGFVTSAPAEEMRGKPPPVELKVSQLGYQSGFARQTLVVQNHAEKILAKVLVECGLFDKGRLIATVRDVVRNISPYSSGSLVLSHPTDAAPDHAQCQIVEIEDK